MHMTERAFLGEWRQVKPDPAPECVTISFEQAGRLTYTVHGGTIQHILLTWRIDGDQIITDQPSAPAEETTRFRFAAPDRLILERDSEQYVYVRI